MQEPEKSSNSDEGPKPTVGWTGPSLRLLRFRRRAVRQASPARSTLSETQSGVATPLQSQSQGPEPEPDHHQSHQSQQGGSQEKEELPYESPNDVDIGLSLLTVTAPAPAPAPEPEPAEPPANVDTGLTLKQELPVLGKNTDLITNFFKLRKSPDWNLLQYRVEFNPALEDMRKRKAMIQQHADQLGSYVYDKGSIILTATPILLPAAAPVPAPALVEGVPLDLKSLDEETETEYNLAIRFVAILGHGDRMNFLFYDELLRKCMRNIGLKEIGKGNYFDCKEEIQLSQHRVNLWPGFTASIKNSETDAFLCVDTFYKVIRSENVMQIMDEIKKSSMGSTEDGDAWKVSCTGEILGSTIITAFNTHAYAVKEICWNLTPESTLDLDNGDTMTYAEWFQRKNSLTVTKMEQPLLRAVAIGIGIGIDGHGGGDEEETSQAYYLIPEFCRLTGLTKALRADPDAMKEVCQYLNQGPAGCVKRLTGLMKRLRAAPKNQDFLQKWGVDFDESLVSSSGRIMKPESILFGGGESEVLDNSNLNWTFAMRKHKMLACEPLSTWVVIAPSEATGTGTGTGGVTSLVETMIKIGARMGFTISRPKVVTIENTEVLSYTKAIREENEKMENLQLMFIILGPCDEGQDQDDTYSAIKKLLTVEIGLPSQCLRDKNLGRNDLSKIVTNVLIKMNSKIGGEPWGVKIPLKKCMTLGYDVCPSGKLAGSRSVGALVGTISGSQTSFFSTVSLFSSPDEMSENLVRDCLSCLEAYSEKNDNELPERILFYRDGVVRGEGEQQLECISRGEIEVTGIREAISKMYESRQLPSPKFTFLLVSKKTNAKFFKIVREQEQDQGRDEEEGEIQVENPSSGTVCDSVVTGPDGMDFFLIPHSTRSGTVTPTGFKILYDTNNLSLDKIRIFTFKLCHLYFHWSRTVAVPAACQYAHKLATQTANCIGDRQNPKLSCKLHYL